MNATVRKNLGNFRYRKFLMLFFSTYNKMPTATKKTTTQKNKPKATKKNPNGGALVGDISKLVVPFGIVLAEKGLKTLIKDDKKSAKATKATKQNTTATNRKAAVGGKRKGGASSGAKNLSQEFDALSSEIEKFLNNF